MSVNQSHVTPSDMHRRVHRNLQVAEAIARGFAGPAGEDEDLRQVAYLGLVKASRGYDPHRGGDFLAYAVPTISGEVKRYLRDHGYIVRPPRRLQELRNRIPGAREMLEQVLHHDPTAWELARTLGVDAKEVVAAGSISPWSVPLTAVRADAGDGAGGDERFETAHSISLALRALPERCRRIIYLRFFRDLTQQQIARSIGVSQVHVSRLIAASLVRMRQALEVTT